MASAFSDTQTQSKTCTNRSTVKQNSSTYVLVLFKMEIMKVFFKGNIVKYKSSSREAGGKYFNVTI